MDMLNFYPEKERVATPQTDFYDLSINDISSSQLKQLKQCDMSYQLFPQLEKFYKPEEQSDMSYQLFPSSENFYKPEGLCDISTLYPSDCSNVDLDSSLCNSTIYDKPVENKRFKGAVNDFTSDINYVGFSKPFSHYNQRIKYGSNRSNKNESVRKASDVAFLQDSADYVELHVTNLDQSLERHEIYSILQSLFGEHVPVVSSYMFTVGDGSLCASITVPSKQDAQYVISQVHRKRIGTKRIIISYAVNNENSNQHMLKTQVAAFLQSIPGQTLPLFKFRELFESHYLTSISLSDLYRMRDICTISEVAGGRIVELNQKYKNSANFNQFISQQEHEFPFCVRHCKSSPDQCWALRSTEDLPDVYISIEELNDQLCKLISMHSGPIPLPSLAICYEAELGVALPVDHKSGVALEHLVNCCPKVLIKQSCTGVKFLKIGEAALLMEGKDENIFHETLSPALAHQFSQFSREIVDLLKTSHKCQLPFNKFIPAYHHHFGRQCRVADYGFTKLIELFDALSSTVQVMGEGNKRTITLTHRAQVRRFTTDLCRVIKTQNSKQMMLSEFPSHYEKVFDREFNITEYGVCIISDILKEVNANTVVLEKAQDGDIIISRPRHNQTEHERRKTNAFKIEAIELLSHAPQYTMQFNKFVPAYHHHFGHQCRVSEYGFTKLIELFEAIPDIVQIIDCGKNNDDRQVCLTPDEAINVLGTQLEQILISTMDLTQPMTLTEVCAEFTRRYGYTLNAALYKCSDMEEVLKKLKHIEIIKTADCEIQLKLQKNIQQGSGSLLGKHFASTRLDIGATKKRKQKPTFGTSFSTNPRSANFKDKPIKVQHSKNYKSYLCEKENIFDSSATSINKKFQFASNLFNHDNIYNLNKSEDKCGNLEKMWPPKSPRANKYNGGQAPSNTSGATDITSILQQYGYGYNYLDEILNMGQNTGSETTIFHSQPAKKDLL